MERRKFLAIILLALAILIIISVPVWLFTPLGTSIFHDQANLNAPSLTPIAFQPLPTSTPQAVLTPKGTPNKILASEGILLDADTGNILYEKNTEKPVPMASTTKIMTALIAIQAGNLDQMITVGKDAVAEGSGASSNGGLVLNEHIKLRDLLYALMLPSGDDAAVAIADGVAGSQEAFVHIMNVEAQRLHLSQTLYSNPDGLEYGLHYTTPYDLARLARYAMSIPLFAKIVQTPAYDLPASDTHHAHHWPNINQLLSSYRGALGIKTGWTPQAGGCLAFAARRNGHTLIGVVLNSRDETTRFTDATTLLNWGFALPTQSSRL